LAPRFISGTGIVCTEAKHPPSHPVPCPFHEKKTRTGKSRGQWAHFNLSVPPTPDRFGRGDIG
jgi:hypothetical protein